MKSEFLKLHIIEKEILKYLIERVFEYHGRGAPQFVKWFKSSDDQIVYVNRDYKLSTRLPREIKEFYNLEDYGGREIYQNDKKRMFEWLGKYQIAILQKPITWKDWVLELFYQVYKIDHSKMQELKDFLYSKEVKFIGQYPEKLELEFTEMNEVKIKGMSKTIAKTTSKSLGYFLMRYLLVEKERDTINLNGIISYARENNSRFKRPEATSMAKLLGNMGIKGKIADLFFDKTTESITVHNPVKKDRIKSIFKNPEELFELIN